MCTPLFQQRVPRRFYERGSNVDNVNINSVRIVDRLEMLKHNSLHDPNPWGDAARRDVISQPSTRFLLCVHTLLRIVGLDVEPVIRIQLPKLIFSVLYKVFNIRYGFVPTLNS